MSGIWCCFAPRVFSAWHLCGWTRFWLGGAKPPSQPRISRGVIISESIHETSPHSQQRSASCHWKYRNFPQVIVHAVTFQHVFRLCLTFWRAQNMELKPRKPAEERWSSNWRPLRGRNPARPCRRCLKRPPHAWLGPHPVRSDGLRTKGKPEQGAKRGSCEGVFFPVSSGEVPGSVDRGTEPTPDRGGWGPWAESESSKWRLRRQVSSTLFRGLREGLTGGGENMDSLLMKRMGARGTRFGCGLRGDQIYTHHSGRSWKILVVFRLRCDAIGWPSMGLSG